MLLAQGCATSMTSMTPARAYDPGEVQVSVVGQANLHTAPLTSAIDSAVSAEDEFGKDRSEPISEESFRQWLDTVLLFGLFRPAFGPEIMIRAGVTDKVLEGLELGFRTDFNLYKGDAKLQVWSGDENRMALSVALGFAYHSGLVSSPIEYLTLTEFGRKDFTLQLLWGWEPNDYIKIAASPHFILSSISAESKIPDFIQERLPESINQYNPNNLFQDEWMFYGGLNTTLMAGYKYAYIALDFGVFWLNFTPTVIGQKRDFSGLAISIAGGPSFHYKF
jgi:hypothetical protein